MKESQDLYELRVAEFGEENEATIEAGEILAIHLHDANCIEEARNFLAKLLATSKQALVTHHNVTLRLSKAL